MFTKDLLSGLFSISIFQFISYKETTTERITMKNPDEKSNIEEIKLEQTLKEIIFVLVFCVIILIVLIKLPKIPLLEILELKSLDMRFIIRDKLVKRSSPPENVVLVLIDDESYYAMNRPLILWNELYVPVMYHCLWGAAAVP